jgi:hypothetical protein
MGQCSLRCRRSSYAEESGLKLEEVALGFLGIPRRFHDEANVSVTQLLKRLGYKRWRKQLTRDVFEAAFRAHPEKMAEWLQWSDDQRCSPAWHVEEDAQGVTVAYYPPKSLWRNRKRTYADRAKGFAVFAKKWLDNCL